MVHRENDNMDCSSRWLSGYIVRYLVVRETCGGHHKQISPTHNEKCRECNEGTNYDHL